MAGERAARGSSRRWRGIGRRRQQVAIVGESTPVYQHRQRRVFIVGEVGNADDWRSMNKNRRGCRIRLSIYFRTYPANTPTEQEAAPKSISLDGVHRRFRTRKKVWQNAEYRQL